MPHHVTQRGSRRGIVFFNDGDRSLYLKLLQQNCERYGTLLIAYCLMDNHVHLILVPLTPESLARTLSVTHMKYALVVNGRNGWTGHLWQERFFSSALDDDYFWTAIRYVERNPVAAGIVEHASQYQWSSAKAHCKLGQDPFLSTDSKWIEILAQKPDWFDWLSIDDSKDKLLQLKECTRRDLPCGNDTFINQLEEQFGFYLKLRSTGRPILLK